MSHLWLLLLLPAVLGLPVLPDIIGGGDDTGPLDPDANQGHDFWSDLPYPNQPETLVYFTPGNQTEPRIILNKAQFGSANFFVDEVLTNVTNLLLEKGFDPFNLPEKSLSWKHNILFVTISVVASLTNGYLSGMSTIQRRGDATLEAISDRLIVTANLGTDFLEAEYIMKAQFMGIGPNCSVNINLEDPEVMIRIQIPINNINPELSYFHVTSLGTVKWSFSCGTLVDYFMPVIETGVNFVANLVKNLVASVLEVVFKDFIEKQVASLVAEVIS